MTISQEVLILNHRSDTRPVTQRTASKHWTYICIQYGTIQSICNAHNVCQLAESEVCIPSRYLCREM